MSVWNIALKYPNYVIYRTISFLNVESQANSHSLVIANLYGFYLSFGNRDCIKTNKYYPMHNFKCYHK